MSNENAFAQGLADGRQGSGMNKDIQTASAIIRESYEAGWHEGQKAKEKSSS